jgi:hypothetical protein
VPRPERFQPNNAVSDAIGVDRTDDGLDLRIARDVRSARLRLPKGNKGECEYANDDPR